MRADMQIISSVLVAMANTTLTCGRFVTSRMGAAVLSEVSMKTLCLPERSDHLPTQFMLNTVHSPPQR